MDAGVAMTFSNNAFGYTSRKGVHMKRLSVAPTEDEPLRTSRSHLLAGLRTAPTFNSPYPDGYAGRSYEEDMNQLMAQNYYLLQRQQQLQQQLMNVTTQQFNGMTMSPPATPSIYSQQAQYGIQPVVRPIPNQPGYFSVYNPMTGQQSVYCEPEEPRPLKAASIVKPRTPTAFGPGMGRAGDHPVRQPRGPPPMDELLAAPTAKTEGSKNFAARQRRRAVHDLVRAGKERSGRGSSDLGTPSSEGEINFSDLSEGSSATDSSQAAIGSERQRHSHFLSFNPTTAPFHSATERRKSPLLLLANAAEKRKSMFY